MAKKPEIQADALLNLVLDQDSLTRQLKTALGTSVKEAASATQLGNELVSPKNLQQIRQKLQKTFADASKDLGEAVNVAQSDGPARDPRQDSPRHGQEVRARYQRSDDRKRQVGHPLLARPASPRERARRAEDRAQSIRSRLAPLRLIPAASSGDPAGGAQRRAAEQGHDRAGWHPRSSRQGPAENPLPGQRQGHRAVPAHAGRREEEPGPLRSGPLLADPDTVQARWNAHEDGLRRCCGGDQGCEPGPGRSGRRVQQDHLPRRP